MRKGSAYRREDEDVLTVTEQMENSICRAA